MVRVPLTHTSDCVDALGDSPPRCSQRAQGGKRNVPLGPLMASCSPVGGKERLVPTTWVSLLTAEMVEVPVRMPVHNQASTSSCGGREGINGTGVSHYPEANHRIASFVYYSYGRNRKICTKTINCASGTIFIAFQAGKQHNDNAASPPLIVGDSRYSAAKPKVRRPLDAILPPTHKKHKKGL